jgi:hypothetical protein
MIRREYGNQMLEIFIGSGREPAPPAALDLPIIGRHGCHEWRQVASGRFA